MNNSTAIGRSKTPSLVRFERRLAKARVIIHEMIEAMEDLEDAARIERAKSASKGKPRLRWDDVKSKLGV
jgi:hypothetical protein